MGCSRYCCTSMISQALRLRKMGKKVRVLFKDIRTYSRHAEEFYEEAMRAGVQFFQYDPDMTPQEAIDLRWARCQIARSLAGQGHRYSDRPAGAGGRIDADRR